MSPESDILYPDFENLSPENKVYLRTEYNI